jgi:hypothetical protein
MNMIPDEYCGSLLPPSCLSTAYTPIQGLGSLSSWYATFIIRKTVMPHVPCLRPIPWMGSSLANPQLQTPFMFTIHAISTTTNQTVTGSTLTTSFCPSTLQSSMVVASSSHSTMITTLQSANRTLLAHKYWTFTQPQDAPVPVPLWIFPLIQLHHHNTSSCGTTSPHALFWLPTCHPLSQNQR